MPSYSLSGFYLTSWFLRLTVSSQPGGQPHFVIANKSLATDSLAVPPPEKTPQKLGMVLSFQIKLAWQGGRLLLRFGI
jgi:hypothetical protein